MLTKMKRSIFDSSGNELTFFYPFSEPIDIFEDKLETVAELVGVSINGVQLNEILGSLDFEFDLFGWSVVVAVPVLSLLARRYNPIERFLPEWGRVVAFPPADNMELPDTAGGFGVPPSGDPKFPSEPPKGPEAGGWDADWRDRLGRMIQRRLDN